MRMTDSASNNSSELVSVAQTAKLLGITRQRVHDLIKNGQIIACKLGRYYYIEIAEVDGEHQFEVLSTNGRDSSPCSPPPAPLPLR